VTDTTNPMLAATYKPGVTLRFPVLASPKIDGIRCRGINNQAMSRSMKPLPNRFLQSFFNNCYNLNGLDGELTVGEPNAPDCYNKTVSAIMSEDGEPQFVFRVFDYMNAGLFSHRLDYATDIAIKLNIPHVVPHRHQFIQSIDELITFEAECLALGYEGVMTRNPVGLYKSGRSTAKEQGLVKIKRFEDAEAVIIGLEELMHNGNEATTSELGYTKRSSHQENKQPTGTLGAFICRGINGDFAGVEFNVGTGFSATQRATYFDPVMIGEKITYKYFPVGVKDKPRHPVFKGFRHD